MSLNIKIVLYIFIKNLMTMKKKVLKIILLSSIILGYSLVLQYPVAQEYYVLVEPYNHGSADFVINIVNIENTAKRIAFNITNNSTLFSIELDKKLLSQYIIKYLYNYINNINYAIIGIDSTKKLILINSTNDLDLLPIFIVDGRELYNCDEALFYFVNNYNYKTGDKVLINNKQKQIVGLFSAGSIIGGGQLVDDYTITCGDPYSLNNILIFIDINNNVSINKLKFIIYYNIIRDFFGVNLTSDEIQKNTT